MSMANDNVEITDNRKWSAATIAVRQQYSYHFGIDKKDIEQLIPLLVTEGFYTPEPGEDGFTLKHVRATINYLKEKQLFEPDLASAVQKLLHPPASAPKQATKAGPEKNRSVATDSKLTQKMQVILHSFLSRNPPFGVMIDGKWGPLTQRAFESIRDTYNLQAAQPTVAIMEQLETISGRIVRYRCKTSNITDAVQHNPFGIIHTDANQFELNKNGVLTRLSDKKALIKFPGLPAKEPTAALSFNVFSAWFMLLNMTGCEEGQHQFGNFNLAQMNDNLLPPQNIVNEKAQQRFLTAPQYVLELNTKRSTVSIDFGENDDNELIGVLLSSSLNIAITKGYQTIKEDKSLSVVFDFEDFFNTELSGNSKEAIPLLEANYLKLFIVKKGFTSNVKETSYKNIPGVEVTADFYKLITAAKEDILATTLIGLTFPVAATQQPENFRERVEKLYNEQPVKVEDDLQKNRWGGKAENEGKILRAGVKKRAPWSYAVTITAESTDKSSPLSGDIAFFLHNTFKDEIRYETAIKGKAQISFTAYEAFTVGAYTADGTMLELDLNEVTGLPKGFYYTDVAEAFKKETERLYQQQKVTVENDLQKNRWGGKPVTRGKILEADVEKSRIPGNYKVTIRLRSENNGRPLIGDVAFFLHNSFKEIRYTKAIDGQATITVNAYEDFTIGAYTQDGSMLELDLNAVKGYPEGFYYKGKPAK